MLYPISVQSFDTIREQDYVYVDKTDLIYELAKQHICFLSRPRRFGKSLLISTLDAYFSGKKDLFIGLKIDSLENQWNKYPVFKIDFAVGNYTKENELEDILDSILTEWELQYGVENAISSLGMRFYKVLEAAEKKTKRKAVVLIDEYDKPMLDVLGTDLEEKNSNTLKGFYGSFKAADEHLQFVLLAGVTKFSLVSVFSGFNQPNDISMDSRYDALCGITEDELYSYFKESISDMANKFHITVDDMKLVLKKQYDGYHFSEEMIDIYNPFSIINAFDKLKIEDYWFRSGTPTYLIKLLEGHQVNMQSLISQAYESSYFMDYRADVENPLAMLYQSGYLTIKGFNLQYREYNLDFPNDEVKKGFVKLIAGSYFRDKDLQADEKR